MIQMVVIERPQHILYNGAFRVGIVARVLQTTRAYEEQTSGRKDRGNKQDNNNKIRVMPCSLQP